MTTVTATAGNELTCNHRLSSLDNTTKVADRKASFFEQEPSAALLRILGQSWTATETTAAGKKGRGSSRSQGWRQRVRYCGQGRTRR
ncbi:hypothetical protein MTO96_033715 [Rhipicephalus appendiculatus]